MKCRISNLKSLLLCALLLLGGHCRAAFPIGGGSTNTLLFTYSAPLTNIWTWSGDKVTFSASGRTVFSTLNDKQIFVQLNTNIIFVLAMTNFVNGSQQWNISGTLNYDGVNLNGEFSGTDGNLADASYTNFVYSGTGIPTNGMILNLTGWTDAPATYTNALSLATVATVASARPPPLVVADPAGILWTIHITTTGTLTTSTNQ